MKATGLIRRIDNLGRIVVPKEVRMALRIRLGDQMEISTYRDGSIILNKYSPIREFTNLVNKYCRSLEQTIGNIILVCDRDNIIIVSSITEEKILEKKVSTDLEKMMEDRETLVFEGHPETIMLFENKEINDKYSAQIISPISCEGYVVGAVILVSREQNKIFSKIELKSCETAALFLGNHMGS